MAAFSFEQHYCDDVTSWSCSPQSVAAKRLGSKHRSHLGKLSNVHIIQTNPSDATAYMTTSCIFSTWLASVYQPLFCLSSLVPRRLCAVDDFKASCFESSWIYIWMPIWWRKKQKGCATHLNFVLFHHSYLPTLSAPVYHCIILASKLSLS